MRRSFNGNYTVTRDFGVYDPAYSNYPGSRHPGTDYGLPANTQLVAGMSGRVTAVYDRPASLKTGRGKEVVIANGNRERKTCHMNRIDVSVGQQVTEGQAIGLSGNTGYSSGPHLHDELVVSGQYVNLEDNLKEEENMNPPRDEVTNAYIWLDGRKATEEEIKIYTSKPWTAADGLYYGKIRPGIEALKKAAQGDAQVKLNQVREIVK